MSKTKHPRRIATYPYRVTSARSLLLFKENRYGPSVTSRSVLTMRSNWARATPVETMMSEVFNHARKVRSLASYRLVSWFLLTNCVYTNVFAGQGFLVVVRD